MKIWINVTLFVLLLAAIIGIFWVYSNSAPDTGNSNANGTAPGGTGSAASIGNNNSYAGTWASGAPTPGSGS